MLFLGLRWTGRAVMMASALALTTQSEGRVVTHDGRELLETCVGQIPRKCCRWGRRWGCDAPNFNQTGCVPINGQFPSCWPTSEKIMSCTNSSCEDAGVEDVCNMQVRLVGMNVCRPTGMKTTVGCPANQWQCQVVIRPYNSPSAPKIQAYVCGGSGVTLCPINHSKCD